MTVGKESDGLVFLGRPTDHFLQWSLTGIKCVIKAIVNIGIIYGSEKKLIEFTWALAVCHLKLEIASKLEV